MLGLLGVVHLAQCDDPAEGGEAFQGDVEVPSKAPERIMSAMSVISVAPGGSATPATTLETCATSLPS
jgi:hypothetical protein